MTENGGVPREGKKQTRAALKREKRKNEGGGGEVLPG